MARTKLSGWLSQLWEAPLVAGMVTQSSSRSHTFLSLVVTPAKRLSLMFGACQLKKLLSLGLNSIAEEKVHKLEFITLLHYAWPVPPQEWWSASVEELLISLPCMIPGASEGTEMAVGTGSRLLIKARLKVQCLVTSTPLCSLVPWWWLLEAAQIKLDK